MHCASCSIIVSDILTENTSIKSFKLNDDNVDIEVKEGINKTAFIDELNRVFAEHNYSASLGRVSSVSKIIPTLYGVLIGIVALVIITTVGKKLGQSGLGESSNGYITALIIGFVASVSTCAAIVGGIVMSIASAHDDKKSTMKSLTSFHVGRIVGFAFFGALLGAFGSIFKLSSNTSGIMLIIVGVIMFYFGLKNVGIIKASKSHMAGKFVSFIRSFQGKSGLIAYAVLGSLTFFVPCGFTQSMQALSLSSGSVLTGLLTMLSFVIGTTPVLALIGFGFGAIKQGNKWSDIIYVAAGVIVIGFAFVNISAGLAVLGIIHPLGI